MITFENWNWSVGWLHNWLFTKLSLFLKYYKLIAIDWYKEQRIEADRNLIQRINFTGNLE